MVGDVTPLGEYMNACELPKDASRKTSRWNVLDRRGGVLGVIEWYGAWRQYTFFPSADTLPVFNAGCLLNIHDFLKTQNDAHRAKPRNAQSEAQK